MSKQIPGLNFIKKIDRWLRKPSSTGDFQSTPLASPTGVLHNRKFIRLRRVFDRDRQSKSREIRYRWKWLQRLLAGTAALFFALMPTVASANIAIVTGTGTILSALTGSNVTLSNLVTSQGTPNNSIATFTGGLTGGTPNIGIDSGVTLVSGNAATAIGPNNSTGLTSGVNSISNDAQLVTLTASNAYDTTSITFDVTALPVVMRYNSSN